MNERIVCGSTHIDVAWKKGREEMTELFERFIVLLLDLLRRRADFTYVLEQAWHLRRLKERRPDLFQEIAEYVRSGRLEVVGGMVSTAETNGPSGEALARNMILGLRWVQANLATPVTTGWLIDTFGLSPQLPQVLRRLGIARLMANRFGGRISTSLFRARGLDGSEVLILGHDVHCPYVVESPLFFRHLRTWSELDAFFAGAIAAPTWSGPVLIMPYTENEVPPTSRMIALVEDSQGSQSPCRFGLPRDFFAALGEDTRSLPVLPGDLNPEFAGTFGLRTVIRLRYRAAENLVTDAEKWNALAADLHGQEECDDVWWNLSDVQFHDVYTGSNPTAVMNETLDLIRDQAAGAARILRRSVAAYASSVGLAASQGKNVPGTDRGLLVVNSLPWPRSDVVLLDETPTGAPAVATDEGAALVTFSFGGRDAVCVSVPAGGLRALRRVAPPQATPIVLKGDDLHIENDSVRVDFSAKQGLSLLWKPTGTPLVHQQKDFLVLQRDEGNYQIETPVAADVGPLYEGLEARSIVHPGAASVLMLKGCFPMPTTSGSWRVPWLGPGSRLDWTLELLLRPDSPRIDLSLRLAWKGESSRVRLRIATTILSADAVYEVPFGTVRRVPYGQLATAKGDWPAHRFVLVEDGAHGLALVNTGAHGVEASAGTLWTTLLRAPAQEYAGMVPDDTSSQHGEHQFLFALVPFQGPWQESATLRSAQELNSPLRLEESASPVTASLFELEGLNTVVLSGLKLADDRTGNLVVRLYETAGRCGDARMYVRGLQDVWKSDLDEERGSRLTCTDSRFTYSFSPFEIATFVLRRE